MNVTLIMLESWKQDKENKMRKALLASISISAILLSGCAGTKAPSSKVGMYNGKYAVTTTVPNNNKGKKVNITFGQTYACEQKSDTSQIKFKLTTTYDNQMVMEDVTTNGKPQKGSFGGTQYFKFIPKVGFAKKGAKDIIRTTHDNSGRIHLYQKKEDIAKAWASTFICTQITNNSYKNTRYMTEHEISAYQHNQQIAVQQRATDSANYNATMARIQAQTNYNTQQILNRTNTYNVKVY